MIIELCIILQLNNFLQENYQLNHYDVMYISYINIKSVLVI